MVHDCSRPELVLADPSCRGQPVHAASHKPAAHNHSRLASTNASSHWPLPVLSARPLNYSECAPTSFGECMKDNFCRMISALRCRRPGLDRIQLDCVGADEEERRHKGDHHRSKTIDLELLLPDGMLHEGCYPLSAHAMRRSLARLGPSLRALAAKVRDGAEVSIATVGGSVAAGLGSADRAGFSISVDGPSSVRFVNWLRQRFPPGNQITHHFLPVESTTTISCITNFRKLAASNPDLVIWDYTANEWPMEPTDATVPSTRSMLETFTRMLLQLPKRPALLFLATFNQAANPHRTWMMQDEVLMPVARLYNQTIVSYRDVAWPSHDVKPDAPLWQPNRGYKCCCHIIWRTHQLIADCLAYTWAVAEEQGPPLLTATSPLPTAEWPSADTEGLQACEGGWLTDLSAVEGNLSPTLEHGQKHGHGWQYLDDARRPGWQFNTSAVVGAHGGVRYSRPLTFAMNFGARPRLVASFLRSYENFGRAIVWLDDEQETAVKLREGGRRFASWCESAGCNLRGLDVGKGCTVQPNFPGDDARFPAMIFAQSRETSYILHANKTDHKRAEQNRLASGACRDHELGRLHVPLELDGHWEDPSSQSFSQPFASGYSTELSSADLSATRPRPCVDHMHQTWRSPCRTKRAFCNVGEEVRSNCLRTCGLCPNASSFPKSPSPLTDSFELIRPDRQRLFAQPGKHRVSIAVALHESGNGGAQSGAQWPLFKLLGLQSC